MDKINSPAGVKKNLEQGQIMVEAMVALSVITIAVMGMFTLTSRSISLNRVTADRYVAVNLANEGVELVKNLIDRNIMIDGPWNDILGFNGTGSYEIDYNDLSLSEINGDENYLYFNPDSSGYYRFKRIITITNNSPEHIEVISKVYWTSRGGIYDFSVKDDFYDLKSFKFNVNWDK